MAVQRAVTHAVETSTLADILERVLDKGIVIAGDIKVKLVDIELLTIQIRLVVCSVDKAIEMGMDWWSRNPDLVSRAPKNGDELNASASEMTEVPARPSAAGERDQHKGRSEDVS
jgi:hypothetical protein